MSGNPTRFWFRLGPFATIANDSGGWPVVPDGRILRGRHNRYNRHNPYNPYRWHNQHRRYNRYNRPSDGPIPEQPPQPPTNPRPFYPYFYRLNGDFGDFVGLFVYLRGLPVY